MLALFWALLAGSAYAAPTDDEIKATYSQILQKVQIARIKQDYTTVAGFGSRLAGSDADRRTGEYFVSEVGKLGGQNVRAETFNVTVPDPKSTGTLTFGGVRQTLMPLWPNLVRTSTCDVAGPLLYVGLGTDGDLKGKDIKGSIVVMEFNSGNRWRNAARLGAKAIVFVSPDVPDRSEAEKKFSGVPLSVPRFYLPLAEANAVLNAAEKSAVARLKCNQPWLTVPAKNWIVDFPGSDPAVKEEPIALFAYSDSMSVVPGLSPGAEEIGGLSTMLEVARIYKSQPHRRPLRLILSGGHGLALAGAREYVQKRLDENGKDTPFLTVTLDISSGASGLGSYARGWYYEYRDEPIAQVRNVSRILRAHTDRLAQVMRVTPARLVMTDAVNNGDNRTWKNNISGKFALDCEPLVLAGINSLTFRTVEDSRVRFDTPYDTLDAVNFGNVRRQVQTVAALMHHLLNDTTDRNESTDHKVPLEMSKPQSMRLIGGFATLHGQIVSFDPTKSFVPDTAVPNTLACLLARQKTMMGVRGDVVSGAIGPKAEYRISGAPTVNSYWGTDVPPQTIAGFRLDPTTGRIDHAASFGVYGAFRYPLRFRLKSPDRQSPIVVFPCQSVDFYDLVDPQELRSITRVDPLDAVTGAEPSDYGFFSPSQDQRLSPEVEDAQVLFFLAGQRYLMLAGFLENRLILTNSSVGDEQGIGYVAPGYKKDFKPKNDRQMLGSDGLFPNTSLNAARDVVAINQTRLDRFFKYRIISPGIRDLHRQAQEEIKLAEASELAKDWGEAQRHGRAAWGYALKAHPVIMSTANDVVNGVVFYLFLLIPFSFFLERLFVGTAIMAKQLGWSIGIFIASFILLRLIHPAFEIVTNPTMIFVAFVMGVLSLIVISFILGKFQKSLKAIRATQAGVHDVDIARSSVAAAAFNLGVQNMRRRKARTILTTLTLVVMTFIVLSFTSIVSDFTLTETPSDNPAPYPGLLVRTPGLDPLQLSTYRTLANEFAGRGTVARRAYYYGADIGDTGVLSLQRADRVAEVRAMVGMDPDETKVLKPQDALLPGGRWFRPGERNVVILPQPLAQTLKVGPKEVGVARITYAGSSYTVIGIADAGILRSLTDLDGDGVMPPDFSLSRRYQEQTSSSTQAFRKYLRLDPASIFFVPAETALALGADLRTIAVRFPEATQTRPSLEALMPRLRLNVYASVPENGALKVKQFSVLQASKSTGIALVIIQLLIASVFVLNTMIASVFERTREIGIFSSIGLAPNHIAMLFFAESLVYGVLGAVAGYYVAQGCAKVIVATGALPGLTLNFSSTSAVLSAVIVMVVVLGSTIFPARKAAQIAAPAMNEEVFETGPEGDVWELPLPFSINAAEAGPITAFLGEWLEAYEGFTIGEFVTKDTSYGVAEGTTDAYRVESTMWLSPYDLGISQRLQLDLRPSVVPGVYLLDLTLVRLAGDPENWPVVNKRFLTSVRKQFLTWRTLDKEQRHKYAERISEGAAVEDPVPL